MKRDIKEKRYKFIKQTSLLVILILLTSIIISLFKNISYGGIRTESLGTNVNGTFDSSTGELVIESTEGVGVIKKTINNTFGSEDTKNNIKKVTFTNPVSITCNSFFRSMYKLETIENLPYLNTSNLTNMEYMFCECHSLTSLDLRSFNTSNVTVMSYMFRSCISLPSIDLSKFDTSSVTNMYGMFFQCHSLTSLDLSKFDTSNVTSMGDMFYECHSLTSLDLSKFDTSNVKYMGNMFKSCSSLSSLNLSSFDTSNVTNMSSMFENCSSLPSIDVSTFDTSNVKNMSFMFDSCSSLPSIDLSKFDTSNVTDMSFMFSGCSSLPSIDLSKFDTSKVLKMEAMFYGCSSLPSIDLSKFDTSNVTDMSNMFRGCSSLISLDLSSFNTSNVKNMSSMFDSCSLLTSLDLSSFNTSNVTNMHGMFCNCSSLPSIDLSKFDTSNVTVMFAMFASCSSLQSIDLIKFDTLNVTDMKSMFAGCSSLQSIDLSKFDTSNVTDMRSMFSGCSSLTSLDLSKFDTSNVTYMGAMFHSCRSLSSLNLSSFDTSNVTDMRTMFRGCSSLPSIDLSSFNTSNVTDMYEMFYVCSSFTSLDLSSFDMSNVIYVDYMFNEMTNLNDLYTPHTYSTELVRLPDTYRNVTNMQDTKKYKSFKQGDFTDSVHLTKYFYNITYNANNGIETAITQKNNLGQKISISNNTFTAPNGKKFKNWNTVKEGTGESYNPGDVYSKEGDINLYAQWEDITYTVTFKNGNTVAKTETVNQGASATAPNLTKTGYTLTWDKEFNNITSDLTVNAVWTPIAGVTYKVEHYKQKTSLDGYELADTENLTGTADTQVTANAKTYIGFSENKNYNERVPSGTITGDGNLVLKLYYDRNNYTVTLNTNGGTVNSGNVTNYTYGIEETLPTDVTKTGEIFAGWYEKSDLTGKKVSSIANTETGNKEYYAKWTKNQYTVTFKDGDTVVKTETVNHGEGATAPTITKQGYTLSWDVDFRNITSDLTVKTVWTANDGEYKIEYYLEQEDGSYKKDETLTENLTGKVGEKVTAQAKTINGYVEDVANTNRVVSGEITEDGSLILKIYYKKEIIKETEATYKIEHYLEQEDGSYKKDGTLTEILTGKVGEKVTAKSKQIKGYTVDTTNTNRVVNGEIAEDGSLVLKVYYKKEIIEETIKNEPIIQDTTTAKPESMPYAGISKTIITISILVIIIGIYYYTRYIKLRKYVK